MNATGEHLAKITNRRGGESTNGKSICDVTCSSCGKTFIVSYGGWSALTCLYCSATLHKSKRKKPEGRKMSSKQKGLLLIAEEIVRGGELMVSSDALVEFYQREGKVDRSVITRSIQSLVNRGFLRKFGRGGSYLLMFTLDMVPITYTVAFGDED